ncbi:hypothetical protein NW764_016307 [Fusarium oxysporum]|nr:hypothetical protein NW764_016307 [Fusarium oxysporum]
MHESALSYRDKTGQEQQDLIRSVQEREHKRNRVPTANVQTTAAAGSATTYAEQRPWLERTRWEITYRNRDRGLHRCLIQIPYLSSYRRPDMPPYLLASAARVPGLFADIVSPYEDEMKINEILNAVDVVMDRCEVTVHSTSPEVEQLDEEAGEDEMHVEYEDMDINENAYGDLVTGDDDDDDDDDDEDDGDLYNTSEDDSDDDDVYMSTEDDHHQPSKSATSPGKAESLASLAELVFGLLKHYLRRLAADDQV